MGNPCYHLHQLYLLCNSVLKNAINKILLVFILSLCNKSRIHKLIPNRKPEYSSEFLSQNILKIHEENGQKLQKLD